MSHDDRQSNVFLISLDQSEVVFCTQTGTISSVVANDTVKAKPAPKDLR